VDDFLPPNPHRVAVQWFFVMENDILPLGFGPALSTNHLLYLARLPFRTSVDAYMEASQAHVVHTGELSML